LTIWSYWALLHEGCDEAVDFGILGWFSRPASFA
jgi:hypothetical protein